MFRQKFAKDKYAVDVIPGMNEVYVSGPAKLGSSDTVFTTRHTDGPWALVPFCSTYRCILGLDSSAVYTTVFPSVPSDITCRTGDLVAFDYNREVHLIVGNPNAKAEQAKMPADLGGDGYRIVLKVRARESSTTAAWCPGPFALSLHPVSLGPERRERSSERRLPFAWKPLFPFVQGKPLLLPFQTSTVLFVKLLSSSPWM